MVSKRSVSMGVSCYNISLWEAASLSRQRTLTPMLERLDNVSRCTRVRFSFGRFQCTEV
jgi:hypothetical protein